MSNFLSLINNSNKTLALAILLLLGACTPESTNGIKNTAPIARSIIIGDINGGDLQIGDTLICEYTYEDADGDPEGKSIYSFIRSSYNQSNISDPEGPSIFEYLRDTALSDVLSDDLITVALSETIPDSDKQTYNTVIDDAGNFITCTVQAVAQRGASFDDDPDSPDSPTIFGQAEDTVTRAPTVSVSVADVDGAVVLTVGDEGVGISSSNSIGSSFAINSPPTATAVEIVDVNGGDIEVDDELRCGYIYDDVDSDVEGDSIYNFILDSELVSSTNNPLHTVVSEDFGKTLVCEVIPVALSGVSLGEPVTTVNEVVIK